MQSSFISDSTTRRCLLIAVCFHLIAAYFSAGFYHWDEHFQVLEFVSYALGMRPAADLPWEFQEQIRPWLQPVILASLARLLSAIGIHDPFQWAFVFRLLSVGLGLASTFCLLRCARRWLTADVWTGCAWLSALLWFLPYLHSRTSSECWSGAFFFLGFASVVPEIEEASVPGIAPGIGRSILAGLLWGLAFECRFQVGFLIVGCLSWCAWKQGRLVASNLRSFWFPAALGLGLALLFGTLADRWGYGSWTFTPYRYLFVNLIEQRAAQWGVSPWWGYLRLMTVRASPPLGVVILAAGVVAFWRFRSHPLTWSLLPFLIVHSAIGHKELRFLFPLADSLPLLLCLGWMGAEQLFAPMRRARRWLTIAFVLNAIPLLWFSVTPAWAEIGFLDYLYHHPGLPLFWVDRSPFEPSNVPLYFYRAPDLTIERVMSYAELSRRARQREADWNLFVEGAALPETASDLAAYCRLEYSTLPSWLRDPRLIVRFHMRPWSLFRCRPLR